MQFLNCSVFSCFLLLGCYHEPAAKMQAHDSPEHAPKITKSKTKTELGPGVLYYVGRQFVDVGVEPKIQIENLDGSVYKELDLLNDTSIISDFYPLAMFLEHDILVFEIVGVQNQVYSVKIFSDRGEVVKKINLEKNKSLRFIPWEDYFLKTDVLLDLPKSIQIYSGPNENEKIVKKKYNVEIDEFAIKEIKGYWMKLEIIHFPNEQYDNEEVFDGWIKWRNKSELLVEIGLLGE